jgi:hypothetical protein
VPATITQQPTNLTIPTRSNATFSVTAIGTGTLHYQWRFNGTILPNATHPTLLITNAQLSEAGNYDVLVTDDIGTATSQTAVLVVLAKPAITQQPQSRTVTLGEAVILSVQAEGTQPMYYRWRKNGATYLWPGESSLTMPRVVLTNAGQYDVVVTNAAGNAPLSTRVFVLVVDPPTNQIVCPGSNAAFRAVVSQPPSNFTNRFLWQFNGVPLTSGSNISAGGKGLFTNDLVLTNVTAAQSGAYTLVLSNTLLVTNTVVATNPVPVTNLVVTTNFAGAPAAFTAYLQLGDGDFDGDGMPDAWENLFGLDPNDNDAWSDSDHDGVLNIAEYWAGTSPIDPTSVLKLDWVWSNRWMFLSFAATSNRAYLVKDSDELLGQPWQVWTNFPAQPTNRIEQMAVSTTVSPMRFFKLFLDPPPPMIKQQPQGQVVSEGDSASLAVVMEGDAPLTFQWRFNGGDIARATNRTLMIAPVGYADGGDYRVRVANSGGYVSSLPAVLTVRPKVLGAPVAGNSNQVPTIQGTRGK